MTCDCPREQDVLHAVATGCWPARVDAELREHTGRCPVCRDSAEIARLLFADRDAAWQEADLPAASSLWWRAQMRARREAAERATRPMVLVERAALLYAAVVLFGMGVLLGPWLRAWGRAALGFVQWLTPSEDSVRAIAMHLGLVPIAIASAALLLVPLLFYFATSDR